MSPEEFIGELHGVAVRDGYIGCLAAHSAKLRKGFSHIAKALFVSRYGIGRGGI
jgi:hypothetical protein